MSFTKPIWKCLARRSARIAHSSEYGSILQDITIRGKMLNPKTNRMVFIDGKAAKILNLPRPSPSPFALEPQIQQMIVKPVLVVRRSARIQEMKDEQQRIEDGMNTTIIILRKTIRILDDTIKM